jgi:surface antigen
MNLLIFSYNILALYNSLSALDFSWREEYPMKIKMLVIAVLIAFTTAACQSGQYGQKQTIGALGGAAAGGLLGAQVGGGKGQLAATAAGALLGALIGSEIGRSMDEVDRMRAEQAYGQAQTAPVGQTIAWDNPNTGNYGTVTPTREGTRTGTGEYCREFQQTVVIGGRQEDAYGVACRQPDGSWEIQ